MQLDHHGGDPAPDRGRPESTLQRRGLTLAALTIAWNVIEAVVAISAGIAAGSIALIGFGFDSTIEVGSAVVVVWQFRAELSGGYDEARERMALRLIAISFFVLAAYIWARRLVTCSSSMAKPASPRSASCLPGRLCW